MMVLRLIFVAIAITNFASAQRVVSFATSDGGLIYGNVYGKGSRAVILAHGGRFKKESWDEQARALGAAGFLVLAIDYRGEGNSRGPGQSDIMSAPIQLDVIGAVHYLRKHGAKTVSVVGGSMGGSAAGDAAIVAPGEIDRIVLLGAAPYGPAEKLHSRSLFIVARDDTSGSGPRLPGILKQYEKVPQPKEMIIVDGSAHAQYLFQTEQGPRVMREILRFLNAR